MPWWGWTLIAVAVGGYLFAGAWTFMATIALTGSVSQSVLAGLFWPLYYATP